MSADNWTVCPRCKVRHAAEGREARSIANSAYGIVPIREWQALDHAANALAFDYDETTFREDYGIYGADSGQIEVTYRGSCEKCGLTVSFEHSHPVQGISE